MAPELRLYPSLSASETVTLAGRLRGIGRTTNGLLERVGLAGRGDDLVSTYSTGMRARLKLALALQTNPSLLLLDEPGSGLDESGKEILERAIEDQKTRGCVIIATNDAAERRFASLELKLA
jgi:ABC-type multidrug transport system ATPase subunit